MVHLDIARYLDIVGRRQAPALRGPTRDDRIESISFAGPVTASARVHSRFGGRCYLDVLTLVHNEGRWQIVAKVFDVTAVEEPCRT